MTDSASPSSITFLYIFSSTLFFFVSFLGFLSILFFYMAKGYGLLPSSKQEAEAADKKSKKGKGDKKTKKSKKQQKEEEMTCVDRLTCKQCSFCHKMVLLTTFIGTAVAIIFEFLFFPRVGFIWATITIVFAIIWIVCFEECRSCACLNRCK